MRRTFHNDSDWWLFVYVHRETLEPLHTITYDWADVGDKSFAEVDDEILAEVGTFAMATGIPPGRAWHAETWERAS